MNEVLWLEDLSYKKVHFEMCRLPDFWLMQRGKYAKGYYKLHCGFDIETTNIPELKQAYMYIWQFQLNDYTVLGNDWEQFLLLLSYLQKSLNLNKTHRLIIWVHNLNYELQFMRRHLNITEVFAREIRKALYVVHDECIEFRDSMAITNSSLEYLAKNYCFTQKLKGDLDYTIMRNKIDAKKLTKKELQYCINDVIILKEFSEFIWNTYVIPSNFLPLTKTGIVRKLVKDGVTQNNKNGILYCYPDINLYSLLMNGAFRGGYVHANYVYVGSEIKNVESYDIVSSYPATMFHNYFCMDKYTEIDLDKLTKQKFEECIEKMSCVMVVTFTRLKSKTTHSVESASKAIRVINPLLDNGRIIECESLTVVLTQADFKIYKMYYKWKNFTVHQFFCARQAPLPRFLTEPLKKVYGEKNKLKAEGKNDTRDYILKKNDVNSFFGMCVTRHPEKEIFLTDEWGQRDNDTPYEKLVKKDFLLPQWGVEITAYSRLKLLTVVKKMDDLNRREYNSKISDVIYCDTDSIKFKNGWKYLKLFEKINREIIKKNKKLFPNEPEMWDLGTFENESKSPGKPCYYALKTLGAKRYIFVKNEKNKNTFGSTISGLKKSAFVENYRKNRWKFKRQNKSIFDVFENGCEVVESGKLAVAYNDEYTECTINGEKMSELSSCCLYPVEFKITIDKAWLAYLNALPDNFRKK